MNALKINNNCACALPHGFLPVLIDGGLSSPELTRLMPHGVRAAYLGFDENLKKNLSVLYKVSAPLCDLFNAEVLESCAKQQAAENKLSQNSSDDTGGKTNLKKQQTNSYSLCADTSDILYLSSVRDLKRASDFIDLPEDTRLIVSSAPYSALGKYISAKTGIMHLSCGDSSSFDLCFNKGYHLKKLSPPAAVILDGNLSLPSAFAYVLSCFFALFDFDVSVLLSCGESCGYIFSKAASITKKLLQAAKQYSKHSAVLKNTALEATVQMSALVEATSGRLMVSGATQAAAALNMLFYHEQRQVLDFFDTAFLLAPLVAKAYYAFLDSEITFCRPPDSTLRAERLTEFLGVSESTAYSLLPPQISKNQINLSDYRLKVYRDQLMQQLSNVSAILDAAYPVYFKLYKDDGYFLKGYISSLDSSLAIGLAAECLKGDTLLSFMRGKGVLDKIIQ